MRNEFKFRSVAYVAVVAVVLATTSCSFSVGFSIKNGTGRSIAITYTLKNLYYGTEPKLMSTNTSRDVSYSAFPPDRLTVNLDTRVVKVIILPGEEVQIVRMADRLDVDSYREEFNLDSLEVVSPDGTSSFSGSQVFSQFRPIEDAKVFYGPKVTRFEMEIH